MPSRIVFALALALLAQPSLAIGATWSLDPETAVAVDVEWSGGTVEVRFPSLSGTIEFDEKRPETARARISAATADAETGVGVVDALVRSRDYLDVERYPTIVFELDKLTQTTASTADVLGQITMRGVTQPVSFAAKVFRYGPAADAPERFEAGFDLTGSIDRTEFGSTGGLPDVGAVLPVRIRLVMSSQ